MRKVDAANDGDKIRPDDLLLLDAVRLSIAHAVR